MPTNKCIPKSNIHTFIHRSSLVEQTTNSLNSKQQTKGIYSTKNNYINYTVYKTYIYIYIITIKPPSGNFFEITKYLKVIT